MVGLLNYSKSNVPCIPSHRPRFPPVSNLRSRTRGGPTNLLQQRTPRAARGTKDMSRLPVPAPTAEPTAAPSTSADGRARRWWTPKVDCPCIQNRRPTATTRRQDAPPAVEPAEGVALPVEGVRVCDAPRAVQNARPVQGVRASSVQTDGARPAVSTRASRTVPVGRAVEGAAARARP